MNNAKILLLDLETSPNLAYVWGKYEQDVIEFEREWSIICYSAKWLDGSQKTRCLADYKGYNGNYMDDGKLVRDLWNLCSEADIIVAHNGDSFDIKKMNARFTYHGLTPPTPYKTVDTKKVAKKYFAFNSNSLNDLGKHLGLGKKVETGGFELWLGCMRGDAQAWKKMKKYNKQDVLLLEKVYLRLRPWMVTHPNAGMYTDKLVCPRCGSGRIQSRGLYKNKTTEYKRTYCSDCGGWGRTNENVREVKPIVSI